ncbi:chemotaxis protein CheY [Smithella sp. SCADC]|jgi:CheY-like chemotaxis protein|nr:chemotaxis protein CheY [Smithella sp. SCADC]HAR50228.1 response regulator [Smithella sp.]
MNPIILVIEDNEQNLYLMRFLLEKNGFTVVEATDGEKGVEMAKETKPHLILLDIQLPRMDGYAVAREIRKNDELSATPIVAVTSYAMVGDRERVLAAGADGYIEKPIDPEKFIEQIKEHIYFD